MTQWLCTYTFFLICIQFSVNNVNQNTNTVRVSNTALDPQTEYEVGFCAKVLHNILSFKGVGRIMQNPFL